MRLSGHYEVAELLVEPGDWIVGRTLAAADLAHEGVLVLGIVRSDGAYLGAPRGSERIEAGETLVLYGREEALTDLDVRRAGSAGSAGDQAHAEAVVHQREIESGEEATPGPRASRMGPG